MGLRLAPTRHLPKAIDTGPNYSNLPVECGIPTRLVLEITDNFKDGEGNTEEKSSLIITSMLQRQINSKEVCNFLNLLEYVYTTFSSVFPLTFPKSKTVYKSYWR